MQNLKHKFIHKESIFIGLIIVALVASAAKYISSYFPTIGDLGFAIILGITLANSIKFSKPFQKGFEYAEKKLLSFAVMLMGFSLNIILLKNIGMNSIFAISGLVIFTIVISFILGKVFSISPSLSLLLGAGNAICGSSAVAASSSVLHAKREEVGLAISVVNLLGTIGIFLLPGIVDFFSYSDKQASLLIGGSLQAVGQVAAAGYSVNESVCEMSLAIKMGRICLLAPCLLVFALLFNKNEDSNSSKQNIFKKLPFYVYGFLFCAALSNLGLFSTEVLGFFSKSSHILLLLAMAGIGLRINIKSLINQGPKALTLGLSVFLLQILALMVFFRFSA